jgi:hypothetical protein
VAEQTRVVEPVLRRLTLDIDTAATPITGQIGDGIERWPFAGWLELAAALTNAIDAGR